MTTINPFDTPTPEEHAREMIRALHKIGAELANIGRELSWVREELQDIKREMKFHR